MTPEDHKYFGSYAAAVERNVFVELLSKVSRFIPLENHAYIGMSGYSMEDQKLISRHLGITRLLAFDEDRHITDRQRFNRPVETCRVRTMSSAELADDVSLVLDEEGYEENGGLIVWLRQLDASAIGSQAREMQDLVGKLPINSIVHLTLNVDFEDWAGPAFEGGVRLAIEERRSRAFEQVRSQLGDMITPDVKPENITAELLPKVIAQAFSIAAGRSIGSTSGTVFEALSLLQFETRKRYLAVTGMIIDQNQRAEIRERALSGHWPFISENWHDIKQLKLPDLTVRERLSLELSAGQGRNVVNTKLGFDIEQATELPGYVDHFAQFHPYYPVFLKAEL